MSIIYCILSESIFSIIYTGSYDIGLETYWKMIPSRELTYPPKNGILKMIFLFPRWDMLIPWRVPPQQQKNHSQGISRLSPLHRLHTQPQLSTLRGTVHSHRNHQQSSTYWAVLPQVARLGPCGSGESTDTHGGGKIWGGCWDVDFFGGI